jgi:hypothetical protein
MSYFCGKISMQDKGETLNVMMSHENINFSDVNFNKKEMNIFAYGELSDFVILQFWERGRDRKK